MTVTNAEAANPPEPSVALLVQRVQALEERIEANRASTMRAADLSSLIANVVRITQDLFPGTVSIQVMNDPEYPQDGFTVIEAQASGSIEQVVDRRAEWHKRITRLSPLCSTLRLTLDCQQ